MIELQELLVEAGSFLAPVLKRDAISKARGQSMIERLSRQNHPAVSFSDARRGVISKALELLREIHNFLLRSSGPGQTQQALHVSSNRRLIDGLFDLVSLEGIYPCLLPGVGIPIERRVKSVLQGGIVTRPADDGRSREDDDSLLLSLILIELNKIALSDGQGLYPALRERTLVDLVAAQSQVAFAPTNMEVNQVRILEQKKLLDETPLSILFPILTSLLHPATPDWLRPHISASLSLLPLRMSGVRSTIRFIASTASKHNEQSETSSGIMLSHEILNHASNLLSSVPSTMVADVYFSQLAPQLLELLDEDGTDMQNAVAYIVGNGILGRRMYGALGTPGWNTLVQPILSVLRPRLQSGNAHDNDDGDVATQILSSSDEVQRAICRLGALTLLHPNPGLVKRLVTPLLFPLWTIICHSNVSTHLADLGLRASQILSTYLKVSAGAFGLNRLTDNLLWDGEPGWVYHLAITGDIEIRKRFGDSFQEIDGIALMHSISTRVKVFLELLNDTTIDVDVSAVFLHVTRHWLLGHDLENKRPNLEPGGDHGNPIQGLVYAKITQEMLLRYKDKITTDPDKVFELIQQILDNFVDGVRASEGNNRNGSKWPSISSLGSIVQPAYRDDIGATNKAENIDSAELASLSLSLLQALLSTETTPSKGTTTVLASLHKTLKDLMTLSSLPQPLILSATTTLSFLSGLTSALPSPHHPTTPSPRSTDQQLHASALSSLSSPLPPIRAEALSQLTALITAPSPVLDIPTTSILLTSVLQDPDEYIYLAAIRALSLLATKHQKTVIRMLVEQYIDHDESGPSKGLDSSHEEATQELDLRLRIGEALRSTLLALGHSHALHPDTALLVCEALLALAGRRVRRPKAAQARRKADLLAQAQKAEAKEAWGGAVPSMAKLARMSAAEESSAFESGTSAKTGTITATDSADRTDTEEPTPFSSSLSDDDDENDDTDDETEEGGHEDEVETLTAWLGTGLAEDLRLRTSALSLLSTLFDLFFTSTSTSTSQTPTQPPFLIPTPLLRSAIDIALSILTLETRPAEAIIRRAAAVLLLSALEMRDGMLASGAAWQGDMSVDVDEDGAVLGGVETVLGYLMVGERDEMVRGHVGVVLGRVGTWRERGVGMGMGRVMGMRVRVGLEEEGGRGLRGLDVRGESGRRVGIEEVE